MTDVDVSATWRERIDALNGVTQMAYDAVGNVLTMTDARGAVTTNLYDALNRVVRTTDALGGVTSVTFDAVGNQLTATDARGFTSSATYDALNRAYERTDARGGQSVTRFDAVGNTIAMTSPAGLTTQYRFDALNRAVQTIDPLGGTTSIVFDAVGNQLSSTDARGFVTSAAYDALNRVVVSRDATNAATSMTYDKLGRTLTTTDPLNRVTANAYDALGRVTTVTDPAGGVTRSTYDKVGNRLTLTDASGNVTAFAFDALNRVTTQTDPFGKATTFGYDANGNTVQVIDRNGRRRTFSFDALNRATGETWWNGATAIYSATVGYDASGHVLLASDPYSRYSLAYDELGRVTSVDNLGTSTVPRVVLSYQYDADSRRTRVADSTGVAIAATYDGRGWLSGLSWTGGPDARVSYGRDANGWVSSVGRFSTNAATTPAVSTHLVRDGRGLPTTLTHTRSNGVTVANYANTFDMAGQLTQEVHHGMTVNYTYDPRGQLLTAQRTGGDVNEQFNYDATGNRTNNGTVTPNGNRPSEDATHTFVYDNEGNLIRRTDKANGESTNYTFDYRNRMTRVERRSAGGVLLSDANYTYDVNDRLIVRSINGATTTTLYDGDEAWADYTAAGQVVTRYLHGEQIDELLARWRPSSGLAWYLADRMGSVVDLVDASGNVLNHIDYGAFGQILAQTNATNGDRFTYTGREYEAKLGLYWYRARWYDPSSGRFMSEDPLGFGAGDMNLWRYVMNRVVA